MFNTTDIFLSLDSAAKLETYHRVTSYFFHFIGLEKNKQCIDEDFKAEPKLLRSSRSENLRSLRTDIEKVERCPQANFPC